MAVQTHDELYSNDGIFVGEAKTVVTVKDEPDTIDWDCGGWADLESGERRKFTSVWSIAERLLLGA